MSAPAFEVGQEVIVLPNHEWTNDRRRAQLPSGYPGRVVKLARTLAHVETEAGRIVRVDLVTGVERGDFPALVTTPEREAEHARRLNLRTELARRGVDTYRVRLSADALERILAIVEAES